MSTVTVIVPATRITDGMIVTPNELTVGVVTNDPDGRIRVPMHGPDGRLVGIARYLPEHVLALTVEVAR